MSFLKTLYHNWFPGNTIAHKLFWKYRYSFKNSLLNEDEFYKSINHPHRQEIVKEFKKFTGIKRVLELGSSWGPNLLLLSQSDPAIDCFGIDISRKMIDAGSQFFKSKDITNIHLIHGDMTSLENFKDNEFDLVITDASFIYVDKNDILDCAVEMIRISRLGMILVEFDNDNQDPLGQILQSNWIRDYATLFKEHSSNIYKRSINEKVWPGKWTEHGKIITIFLNK